MKRVKDDLGKSVWRSHKQCTRPCSRQEGTPLIAHVFAKIWAVVLNGLFPTAGAVGSPAGGSSVWRTAGCAPVALCHGKVCVFALKLPQRCADLARAGCPAAKSAAGTALLFGGPGLAPAGCGLRLWELQLAAGERCGPGTVWLRAPYRKACLRWAHATPHGRETSPAVIRRRTAAPCTKA